MEITQFALYMTDLLLHLCSVYKVIEFILFYRSKILFTRQMLDVHVIKARYKKVCICKTIFTKKHVL